MPYSGEKAGKGGHADLVKNPDVSEFLMNCEYVKEPNDQEGSEIAESYVDAPTDEHLPAMVMASDASVYSDAINGKFPSTQIGYVKVSLMLINLTEYGALKTGGARFVDPFKVASIHRKATPIAFTLPGSNVRYKGANNVQDGFRKAVFEQYSSEQTNFRKEGRFTLLDTLFEIHGGTVTLEKRQCPDCGCDEDAHFLTREAPIVSCQCGREHYATDILRLHEQVGDHTDSSSPITRFMNVTEHLLMASFVRWMSSENPNLLSKMGFIIDGPLAIFGEPAKIHSKLQSFYFRVGQSLENKGLNSPIILGLQKDGQIMEHARSINRFLKPNTYRIVDDKYRERYISGGRILNDNFGHETYYGQDFIFKTQTGRIFSIAIPYPFDNKDGGKKVFSEKKSDARSYKQLLGSAFNLVRYFEFDLYQNAIVPVALAHRHASISVTPGGRVLDVLSHTKFGK